MIKKTKKGFTLVELLVVIAILAILATVSVVGYLGFTKKAEESNDISLTTQINTILQGEGTIEGANKNPYDAVRDLQDNGLDITKLTPTREGYEFLYDLTQDKFFLVDGSKVVAPSNLSLTTNDAFVYTFIGNGDTLSTKYSNYLKDDFVAPETLEISTGLDVGNNQTVTNINYTNNDRKTVNIRTNGGTLTVNAPNDTVNHYGEVNEVNVLSIAAHSYHENGVVIVLFNLLNGHVVLENTAQLKEVIIPENANSDANITVEKNAKISTLLVDKAENKINIKSSNSIDKFIGSKESLVGTDVEQIEVFNKTFVSDDESLQQAITNKSKYIVFSNDIISNATPAIAINYDVTIDGQNHKLTANSNRCIWLQGSNIDVVIKNIDITSTANESRGIQINMSNDEKEIYENIKLLLSNVNVLEVTHYALNIMPRTEVYLQVHNSSFKGYSALTVHSDLAIVNFENCILHGINKTKYDPKQWNDYGTIVISGKFEGFDSHAVISSNINFHNSEIIAESLDRNKQAAIDFQNESIKNIVSLTNTKITKIGDGSYTCSDDGKENKIFIDGTNFNTVAYDFEDIICNFDNVFVESDNKTISGYIIVSFGNNEVQFNISDMVEDGEYYCFDIIQESFVFKCLLHTQIISENNSVKCNLGISQYI